MATNIYDATAYPVKLIYDNNAINSVTADGTLKGPYIGVNISTQHKGIGIKDFPVEQGKIYDIKITNAPSLLGADGTTVYTYDTFNCIWLLGDETYGVYREFIGHYGRTSTGKYYTKINDGYTGSKTLEDFCYQETDFTNKIAIYDGNDLTRSNKADSAGGAILTYNTNYLRIKIVSPDIKYITLMICPTEFSMYCINSLVDQPSATTTINGDDTTTLFKAMETALTIEEIEESAKKIYIQGDPVANATSYELYAKEADDLTLLATKNEINFNLDELNLSAGIYTLVVKAKANGYRDSEYSNEVVYTQA